MKEKIRRRRKKDRIAARLGAAAANRFDFNPKAFPTETDTGGRAGEKEREGDEKE